MKFKALRVRQWLNDWDQVNFTPDHKRRKPDPQFYLTSIPARTLMRLSNVYRRNPVGARIEDEAIQRKNSSDRVDEISRFIVGGYPWSDISEKQRAMPDFQDLRMPGWLPTAIIANTLAPGVKRLGKGLDSSDAVKVIANSENDFYVELPEGFESPEWNPVVKPIEIIDGQHRLLAFAENDIQENFDIPVVIFNNLDITWQAYLFYTINIKPKRINTSLAFDLYPLLRVQDWLEKSSNAPAIYRETRAQELTEILWSHPSSIWKNRISMLGEDSKKVSQAAFIRSLINSYIKRWDSKSVGGLFGGAINEQYGEILAWTRSQQAAFLLVFFEEFFKSVENSQLPWAMHLKSLPEIDLFNQNTDAHSAFWGKYSLINSDQGVRGLLQISNDIFYVLSNPLKLANWESSASLEPETIDAKNITTNINNLKSQEFYHTIAKLGECLSHFDWRSPVTPDLSNKERIAQQGFKGSSGYKELRRRLALLLAQDEDENIGSAARTVLTRIN